MGASVVFESASTAIGTPGSKRVIVEGFGDRNGLTNAFGVLTLVFFADLNSISVASLCASLSSCDAVWLTVGCAESEMTESHPLDATTISTLPAIRSSSSSSLNFNPFPRWLFTRDSMRDLPSLSAVIASFTNVLTFTLSGVFGSNPNLARSFGVEHGGLYTDDGVQQPSSTTESPIGVRPVAVRSQSIGDTAGGVRVVSVANPLDANVEYDAVCNVARAA